MSHVGIEKGLDNNFGQNNCFLNVVIQSLWHLESFCSKFRLWENHTHNDKYQRENCPHCSLKV